MPKAQPSWLNIEDVSEIPTYPLRLIPGIGGAERDRTVDPLLAKQVLSQLSYSPSVSTIPETFLMLGGPGKIRTSDLTLIRGAL